MYQKFYKVNSMYQNFKKKLSLFKECHVERSSTKTGYFGFLGRKFFGKKIFLEEIFLGGKFFGEEIFKENFFGDEILWEERLHGNLLT